MATTSLIDLISGEYFLFNRKLAIASEDLRHNDLENLNVGDYIHLTQSEKDKLDELSSGDTYYAWTVKHVDTDVELAEPQTIYIVDAIAEPISITLPDAISGDTSEYKIILEKDTHKVTITTQSETQLIGGYTSQIIPTVGGSLHIKSNDNHFDIINDVRMMNDVIEINSDRDFTVDGYENFVTYLCNPDGGNITLTLPEPTDPHADKSICAHFILNTEGTVNFITESGETLIGDSVTQSLSIKGTSFTIVEADLKYFITQDSRPKALNVPISTYPLNEDSDIIDPLTGDYFKQRCGTIEDPRYDKENAYYFDTTVTASPTDDFQILSAAISDENIFKGIIPEGLIDSSFIAAKISGNRNVSTFVRYSRWDSGGTEHHIADSNNVIVSGSDLTNYDSVAIHSGFTMNEGDRIIVRIYGRKTVSGGDPVFRLSVEGPTPSRTRIEIPVNTITHNSLIGLNVGDFQHLTQDEKNDLYRYDSYLMTNSVVSGGTLAINETDNTKFDINPFYALFSDPYIDLFDSKINSVYFDGVQGLTPTYLNEQQVTYISIDKDLNIYQTKDRISFSERRERIELGMVLHNNLINIDAIQDMSIQSIDLMTQTLDFIETVGIFKADFGNVIYPNNDLSFKKTSGNIFKIGSNKENSIKVPNIKFIEEYSVSEFYYWPINNQDSDPFTQLITDEYELVDESNTGSTIIQITGNTTQATVQRIFLFESGKLVIQRGQEVYNTIQEAVNGFLNEDYIYGKHIMKDALLIGCIATTVDCYDLSDTSRAVFISVDRYGSIIGATNTDFEFKENDVIVSNASDLPDPDENNLINLYEGYTYNINGFVDLHGASLNLANKCVIKGDNPANDILYTENANQLLKGVDGGYYLNSIGLMNPTGELLNLDGQNNDRHLSISFCYFFEHAKIGQISGYHYSLLDSIYVEDVFGQLDVFGGDVVDNNSGFYMSKVLVQEQSTTGNTFININDGYFSKIKLWDNIVTVSSGNTFAHVDHDNVNYSGGTLQHGLIITNVFSGEGDYLTGIDSTTNGWFINGNDGLPNSHILGYIKFANNTNETIVNTENTYYKVEGVNNGQSIYERTDISVNNRILYNCPCTPLFRGSFVAMGSISTNTNNTTVNMAVIKNGDTNNIISSVNIYLARADEPISFSFMGFDQVRTNDYYEIWVSNNSNTSNLVITDMQFKLEGDL